MFIGWTQKEKPPPPPKNPKQQKEVAHTLASSIRPFALGLVGTVYCK